MTEAEINQPVHKLKIWPEYFMHVADGLKPLELRKNDRKFCAGDLIYFEEWDPEKKAYTGRACTKEIKYVLEFAHIDHKILDQFGLNPSPPGFKNLVVLQLART